MIKHIDSERPEEPTRLYPKSYRGLHVFSYRGMDTQHVADQVTNINPRDLPQIDAVYVMVGTNNIKGRCSCDSVKFAEMFTDLINCVHLKFPMATVFVNIVLPRFDYNNRQRSHFLSKINHFNAELVSLRNRLNFVLVSNPFHITHNDALNYIQRTDKLHFSYTGNILFKKIVKANIHCYFYGFASIPTYLRYLVDSSLIPASPLPLQFPDRSNSLWGLTPGYGVDCLAVSDHTGPLQDPPASQDEVSHLQYSHEPVNVRTYASVTSPSEASSSGTPASASDASPPATTTAHCHPATDAPTTVLPPPSTASPDPAPPTPASPPPTPPSVSAPPTPPSVSDPSTPPHDLATAPSTLDSATAPPTPATAPPTPATAPPTPATAPSIPATAPLTPATAPSIPDPAPPTPATAPSIPATAPLTPATAPSIPDPAPPTPKTASPTPATAPPTPATAPPTPATAPSIPATAPSVPDPAPPTHAGAPPPASPDPCASTSLVSSKCPDWLRKRLAYYKNLLSVRIVKDVEKLLLAKVEQGMFVRQGIKSSQVLLFGEHKYVYNGATQHLSPIPLASHPILQTVLSIVNMKLSSNFNSILVNFYKDPSIILPYHKDDERHLDKSAKIATLSIGATRNMDFATCKRDRPSYSQQLLSNSLFVMDPETQISYFHRIAPGHSLGYRFSLTFRTLKPRSSSQPSTLDKTERVSSCGLVSLKPSTLDKTEGVLPSCPLSKHPTTSDENNRIQVSSSSSVLQAPTVPSMSMSRNSISTEFRNMPLFLRIPAPFIRLTGCHHLPLLPCTPDMTEGAGVSLSAAHPTHTEPCTPDMTEGAGVSLSAAHPTHTEPCTPDMTEGAGVSSSSPAYGASISHNVCHTTKPSRSLMYGGGRHNNPFIDNEAQDEEGHVSQESHDYNNYKDSTSDMDNFIDDTESHDSQEYRPYYDCHDDSYVQRTAASTNCDTLSNMTDKGLHKEKDRNSARNLMRQHRASMTSPQRSQIRQYDCNRKSQTRANMTATELIVLNQKKKSQMSQTRASLTTPERNAEKERNRLRKKARRASMTDEQKKLEKEKRRNRISLNKARNSSSQKVCSPVLLRQDSPSNMSAYKTPPATPSSAIHHHNYSRSPASSLKTAYSPHDISFHTVNVARNNTLVSPLNGYGTSTQSLPKLHSTPPHHLHSQHLLRSPSLRHSRAKVSTETNIDIACAAKSLLRSRSSSNVPTRPQTTLDWDFARFPHGSKLLAEIELNCANKCTFCPGFMENCPFTHLKSVSPNQHFTRSSKPSAYQSPPIGFSSLHNFPVEDQPEVTPRPISTLDWDFVRFPHGSKLLAEIELNCANKCTFCPGFMENCPFTHFQSVSQDQHFPHSSEPSACQSPPIESSSMHNFFVEDQPKVQANASKDKPVPLKQQSKSPPKPSYDPKTDNIVKTFRAKMREYPEYACIKCHKLFFREGVVKAKDTLKFKLNIPSVTKANNKWICKRCNSYLKRGKFSPIDVNEMFLASGDLPSSLQPNPTECRLISQIIPFMKILSLPAGGQSCIKGPVVNVPIQPDKNCMQLPRKLSESGILAVRIKRKVEYKSVVMSDVVNPDKCITLLVWLKKNNPFYKNVVLSHDFIKQNYDGDKQFFESYMNDDPVVVSMSILDLILSNVTNEGTYCDMPFESCIQKSDPAENIDDGKIPFMDFAPGQGSKPVPFLGNADYEALSFPDLFPLGKGHFNCSKRNDLIKKKLLPKLSLKDYAESKLYSKDRKYAQNPEYIFYMQNWIERDQILSCIATHMRKGSKTMDGQIITAGLLRSYQCNMDQLQSNIDAYKFMKNMKGTPAYLQKIKNDGIAMVNQLGNFTWFLTFSFNDLVYSVPAILKLMGQEPTDELLSDISWYRKHELIKLDPVIAVRMFDRYVRKILSYLIEDQGVMGEALAHFGRNEFGGRGSPHLHMLLKVVGAPIPGESPIEEVIAFIDKYVTTHYPTLEEDPEVHKLIKLQLHSHTKTCQKGGKDICRFGFPKPLSEVTKILFREIKKMMQKKSTKNQKSAETKPKVEAPKLRSKDVIYKREPGSEYVNTYNRLLLLAVQGNMDVQICMSMWDVVNYIISYATKNEKEVCDALKDVIKNIDQPSNKNSKEALRQLGNTFLNSRSVSIQEATFRCLPQLSLSHFKPSVLFIPSDMPGDRHGIVKPRSTLQQLPDDSEDVFHNSLLDKYLNRPDDLESTCWAEFASLYVRLDRNVTDKNRHKVITLKSNLGQMIRRDSPQIIRSNKKSRTKQPEKYYYSKLCLYFPWRKETDLIGTFTTYQESFAENVDVMKPNIKKFEQFDDDTLQKMEAEIRQEIKDSLLDEKKREVLDGRHLFNHPFEGIDISKEEEKSVFNVTYKEPIVSDEQYHQMVTSLNVKQQELFNIVDHHSSRVAQGQKVNQLLHFVSGAGGVGKSFLIKCMRSCISRKFPDSIIKPRVAVAASTGVAAALIDGQTVHQLLQLDCQEGGRIQPNPYPKTRILAF